MDDDNDSPFAHVPEPGIHEPGSNYTYEGTIARFGDLARGMSRQVGSLGRSGRIAIGIVIGVMLVVPMVSFITGFMSGL